MALCPASCMPLFPRGTYLLLDVAGFTQWKQCSGCGRLVKPCWLNGKAGMPRYFIPRHNA